MFYHWYFDLTCYFLNKFSVSFTLILMHSDLVYGQGMSLDPGVISSIMIFMGKNRLRQVVDRGFI